MREIVSHRVLKAEDLLNSRIRLEVADDPDRDGINHKYQFFVYVNGEWTPCKGNSGKVDFHTGPLQNEAGQSIPVNGVSDAALLSVLIDRLESYGKSRNLSTRAKSIALTHLQTALFWLQSETK